MLAQTPRVLCLRPVAGAAAAASILSAGAASTPCLLPALALAQNCRLPAVSASSCVCCIHTPPSIQQRCHVHHRPSASASATSTSGPTGPLADPRPRPRPLQLPSASFPFLPTPASPTPTSSSSAPGPFSSGALRCALSSHAPKRRRVASGASTSAAAAAQSDEPAPAPLLLSSGLGQVIASASNYVRVEVYQLLPDQEPTPTDWRPPHLRPRPRAPAATAAAAAATSPPPPPAASEESLSRPRLLLCSIRALLRKLRVDVVVGDVVRVGSIDWGQGRGVVSEVLPRSSRLVDPSVANVDHVLLVFALDQPPFEEYQVSRFLVAAEAAGLPFSLVLNKADLVPPEQLSRRMEQCRSWGYEPIVLSCERGEGVEQVAEVLQGRISVVAGPSGAGKSSLINSLRLGRHRPDLRDSSTDPRVGGSDPTTQPARAPLPPGGATDLIELPDAVVRAYGSGGGAATSSDEEGSGSEEAADSGSGSDSEPEFLAVGSLSKIGRGMHTTTAVTLLRLLGGGWLADTPGFGQPTLDDIPSQHLSACFPEMSSRLTASPCRFSDCLHLAEPGCGIREAGLERYAHYTRFLQEIRAREADDVRQLQRAKSEREGATKAKSVRGGGERQEARLDPRRHRRQSRQSSRRLGQLEEEELLG
ncbi:hypothetical protein PLESTM_001165100 [Pleodorina starrii]|nr:hypothetical protein PLESTM_001165100 [Pleodorina starrii]